VEEIHAATVKANLSLKKRLDDAEKVLARIKKAA